MRRCRFACVGALLLALLLTGCGKAGTAPEDGGADFSETEQVETPEAADALTVKEIAQVNGFLVTHLCGRMGCSYMYPAGSGDLAAAIDILAREADERRQPLRRRAVSGEIVPSYWSSFSGPPLRDPVRWY